jgi:hypothetical protein
MNLIFTITNGLGIGDNIRGIISLLQICSKIKSQKDINVFVDFSKHRINKYLLNKLPDELLETEENKEIKNFHYADEQFHDNEIIDFLLNSQANIVRINTNNFPDVNDVNEEIKSFIKNLFVFDLEFEKLLNSYFNVLPETYHLYHYRFGDHVLLKNDNDRDLIKHFLEYFKINKKNGPCVIISDSLLFKRYVYEFYKNKEVFVFLTKPTHTSYDTVESEHDVNILIDFMLITKAESINCYSSYRWISNFILWTSYVYNVPLFNMK